MSSVTKPSNHGKSLNSSYSSTNTSQANYVGFAELPNTHYRKHARKGFHFTVGVVGEGGIGKSTLIESLFFINIYDHDRENYKPVNQRIHSSVEVEPITIEIDERGIKVRLTIVDLPGYGDSLTGDGQFEALHRHIDQQFDKYYNDETGLNRRNLQDTRVHCILYFINPNGRGLKPLDISFIKNFQHKVNIIPIIAKSDTLTKVELLALKKTIRRQLAENELKVYETPSFDEEDLNEPEISKRQLSFKERFPFAVIGADGSYKVGSKNVRGRMYPWGVVDIEDENHSDFKFLKDLLVGSMQDLQEYTHDVHYEGYRAKRMQLCSGGSYSQMMSPGASSIGPEGDSTFAERDSLLAEKDSELKKLREQMAAMQAQVQLQTEHHNV